MTSDQLDAVAEGFAGAAVELAGPDDATGVLIQALMLVHLEHHGLDAAAFCIGALADKLRDDVAREIKSEGTVQ